MPPGEKQVVTVYNTGRNGPKIAVDLEAEIRNAIIKSMIEHGADSERPLAPSVEDILKRAPQGQARVRGGEDGPPFSHARYVAGRGSALTGGRV
jgi:hypothetical protein